MAKKTKTKRPVETLRDGAVKAAIWKNEGENGSFYNVTVGRTYKDKDGDLNDSDSFSGTQLLQLSRLSGKAYDRWRELTRALRAKENGNGDENEEDEIPF